MIFRRA